MTNRRRRIFTDREVIQYRLQYWQLKAGKRIELSRSIASEHNTTVSNVYKMMVGATYAHVGAVVKREKTALATHNGRNYKPVYMDGLGWISDKPQREHIEYSKERYYAELVTRARDGLERIRMAGRDTAETVTQ